VDAVIVTKAVGLLLTAPLVCLALCTFRVEPIHGWMMRHDCPFARMSMDPPSHPIGVPLDRRSGIDRAQSFGP
jgi:hypothetical protein